MYKKVFISAYLTKLIWKNYYHVAVSFALFLPALVNPSLVVLHHNRCLLVKKHNKSPVEIWLLYGINRWLQKFSNGE